MSANAPVGRPPIFSFQNILILLGIIITIFAVFYFTSEFIDRMSDWGRLIVLVLITILFVSLGLHFEQAGEYRTSLVDRRGFRWIRIPTAMFLIGGFAGVFSTGFFLFSLQEVDRRVKVLVVLAIGLGLIFTAARLMRRHESGAAGSPPSDVPKP